MGGVGGGGMVRRAASMVVPVSAIEQALATGGQCDSLPGWDRPLPAAAAITARPTSILDGMSRSCSALPCHGGDPRLEEDGLLLPPSPFRSPDFDDDDDDAAGSCLDGVLASCGYASPPASLAQPTPNTLSAYRDRADAAGTILPGQPNGHRHLALLGDLGPRSDPGGFVWTSLPSPDDVTPTNENQPHGFAPSNGRLPPPPPRLPPASLGDKCPPVRYSDL